MQYKCLTFLSTIDEAFYTGFEWMHTINVGETHAGVRPRCYRVSASLGGIRNLMAPAAMLISPALGVKDKYSPLSVICLYLDFKVTSIVVSAEVFKFTPFDGEMDITSLEAYPLRYNSTMSDDDFMAQGLAFVDLMLVRHRQYDGFTASEEPEEVHFSPFNTYEELYS